MVEQKQSSELHLPVWAVVTQTDVLASMLTYDQARAWRADYYCDTGNSDACIVTNAAAYKQEKERLK